MRMDWSCHVLLFVTFYVIGTEAACSDRNCTDFWTTTSSPAFTSTTSDDKDFSSVWSTYQVAFFFGVFVLILGILCVIVVKRKAALRNHSQQQQERQCGLMTAAIYDILSQSQRATITDVEANEIPEVVHPVKPPSYDEVTKESSPPQAPPPSYRESLIQSLNEYPQHFCQHPKY
ncbi:uncharacterized protein LOC125654207 [Ostrea edulis]|uniref:uncharacterized protein LOC125654207 n=1 Tax=Ostrea edulis TaxID=37623 RepID=UPI0024AF6137|nr:uncharacterized protein LOC125654207 [Ostrea edulis]